MVRTIKGLAFKDPATSPISFMGEWWRRQRRTLLASVPVILLGLLLIGLCLSEHVWDLKDKRMLLAFALGLGIVIYYPLLILKCLRDPLRVLAKRPDARRFVLGELVSADWAWNDFGWGRHPEAKLRFNDAQGQAHEFIEPFSMGAWFSFVGSYDAKEAVPVWIVYDARAPQVAAFVGLQQEWVDAKLGGPGAAKLSFWQAALLILVMGSLTVGILIFFYRMGWME